MTVKSTISVKENDLLNGIEIMPARGGGDRLQVTKLQPLTLM